MPDTLLRNRPNHSQTLIEKPLYSGHLLKRALFWASREHFGQNFPLNSGNLHDWSGKKKTHACFYLTHFSTFTWSSLSNFSIMSLFLHLHKKWFTGISSTIPTLRLTLFPVTSIRMWWFVSWRNLEATLLQFSGTLWKLNVVKVLY